MAVVYSYERIADLSAPEGFHFRVRDSADNRIATCWDERNAALIVKMMNRTDPVELLTNFAVEWTCGHVATCCCAECYQKLAQTANDLSEKYQLALDQLTERSGG